MKKALLHITFITALCTSVTVHAYWWRFNNFTQKVLLLKVKLAASNNPYYAIVHPEMSVMFDWSIPNIMSGFCLDTIKWIEINDELLSYKDLINDDHMVINNKKLHLLFSGENPRFTLYPATLEFMPSELYDKTVKAVQKMFKPLGSAIKWIATQLYQSPCRSRDISIIEDNENTLHFIAAAK